MIKNEKRYIEVKPGKVELDSKARDKTIKEKNIVTKYFNFLANQMIVNINNSKTAIKKLETVIANPKTLKENRILAMQNLLAEYEKLQNINNEFKHHKNIVKAIANYPNLNDDPIFKQIPKKNQPLLAKVEKHFVEIESKINIMDQIKKLNEELKRIIAPASPAIKRLSAHD